jgi:uncharacterized membrane protein
LRYTLCCGTFFVGAGTILVDVQCVGMENPASELTPFTEPRLPSSPSEVTTALVHYYRAEMARMSGWRDRLDRTSNWAITVTGALLSVSLSTPSAHHGVLLFAMLLVALLLYIEARRYRFYDVYRQRVRQFERHYFGQLFAAAELGNEPWLKVLADDLRHPRFRITLQVAITRRLRRNYIWMFAILLLAWALKITSPKLQEDGAAIDTPRPLATVVANAALGPLPGWFVIAAVTLSCVGLLVAYFQTRSRGEEDEVHV